MNVEELAYEETRIGLRLIRAAMDDPQIRQDCVALDVRPRDFFLPALSVACDAVLRNPQGSAKEFVRSHLEDELGCDDGAQAFKVIMAERPIETDNLIHIIDTMRSRVAMRRIIALGQRMASRQIKDNPIELARELEAEAQRISADSISITGASPKELAERAMELASGSRPLFEHVALGLGRVDEALGGGAPRGRTTLYVANTGVGKSTFGKYTALYTARENNPVVLFSTEEGRDEIARTFIEYLIGCSCPRPGDIPSRLLMAAMLDAGDILGKLPIYVEDVEEISAAQLVAKMRIYVRRHGVTAAVVDYVQDLELVGHGKQNELHAYNSKVLKVGARQCNVAMIQLSQVSADADGKPQADSVAGAKRFAKDAVATIIFDRDKDSRDDVKKNTNLVSLKKNRIHRKTVDTWLRYDMETTRLHECDSDGRDRPDEIIMPPKTRFWYDEDDE